MTEDQIEREMASYRIAMNREIRRVETCERLAKILVAMPEEDEPHVAELMQEWLESVSAGMPDASPFAADLRANADFWADIATPAEVEAYVGAGLRRIERTNFAEVTRKRLFVMLWEQMADADRRAFVQRVDPHGQFQRRMA